MRNFFVRAEEHVSCPCCFERLKVIGSRPRKFIIKTGEAKILIVRRLKCINCKKIHHELPDILVPYKRYDSSSIETVIDNVDNNDVVVDDSTIYRWKSWFYCIVNYMVTCIQAILAQHKSRPICSSGIELIPLKKLKCYTGDAVGWLARIVKPIVNSNLWVQTRSALMS